MNQVLDEIARANEETADDAALAGTLLGIVARACHERPERAAALIPHLGPPLARLGFRRAETVLHWLEPDVLPGFGPRVETDADGRRWLNEALPRQAAALQRALDDAHERMGPDDIAGSGLRDLIANSLQNQGRYAEALPLFEELAAESDPLRMRRATIAWLRAMLGDTALAEEVLEDGIHTELVRARVATALGRLDRAVELLRDAVAHNPDLRPEFEGGFEPLFDYPPYLELFGPPLPSE